MKQLRKCIVAFVLAMAAILGTTGVCPTETAAAASMIKTDNNTVTITWTGNKFDVATGMYKIGVKITNKKNATDSLGITNYKGYDFTITGASLVNSSGKAVRTWKSFSVKTGATWNSFFMAKLSTLPSGKYTFKISCKIADEYGKTRKYTISTKIDHSQGAVNYKSTKYSTLTDGNTYVDISYYVRGFNGKTPKIEIYNSKNSLVYSYVFSKVNGDDVTKTLRWNGYPNKGKSTVRCQSGTYTVKFTVGGKSVTKKLNFKFN